MLQFYQKYDSRNWILLDTQSTTTIYCNKNYVTNIRKGLGVMKLDTNAGSRESNKICKIPDFNQLEDTKLIHF